LGPSAGARPKTSPTKAPCGREQLETDPVFLQDGRHTRQPARRTALPSAWTPAPAARALVQQCTQEHRLELGKRLKALERFAPTHPHPKAAGSPAALLLRGPFAAMLDRIRDAITD